MVTMTMMMMMRMMMMMYVRGWHSWLDLTANQKVPASIPGLVED